MSQRQQRLERMRDVEREYLAALAAIELLAEKLREDPAWGAEHDWRAGDAVRLQDNLEDTYLIRVFAEFESGLRSIWRARRRTHPRTRDMIDSLATQRVSAAGLQGTHNVREYRNWLVHEDIDDAPEHVDLRQATRNLCIFFSGMPENW